MDVEEVDLVVTANSVAVRVIYHGGRCYTTIFARSQWNGSCHYPHAKATGRRREKVLNGPGALRLRDRSLVCIPQAHEGEVFRHHGKLGAQSRSVFEQRLYLLEVCG